MLVYSYNYINEDSWPNHAPSVVSRALCTQAVPVLSKNTTGLLPFKVNELHFIADTLLLIVLLGRNRIWTLQAHCLDPLGTHLSCPVSELQLYSTNYMCTCLSKSTSWFMIILQAPPTCRWRGNHQIQQQGYRALRTCVRLSYYSVYSNFLIIVPHYQHTEAFLMKM